MGAAEKKVEDYLVDQVELLGGEAYKFTSPNRRFVVDRICALPYGLTYWIEVKSPKGVLHPGQEREQARLYEKGHKVGTVSTKLEVNTLINDMKEELNAKCIQYGKLPIWH